MLLKQGCQHLKNQSPSGLISYKGQREGRITHKHTHTHTHTLLASFILCKDNRGQKSTAVRCPSCLLSFCFKSILKNTPHLVPAGIKAGAISSSAPHLRPAVFKSEVAVVVVNSEHAIEVGMVKRGGVFSVESTGHAGAYLSH